MKSTDVIPLAVYGVPLVGLLVLSLLKPNAGRIAYAIMFVLVGCGINYTVSFAYPGSMQSWSQVALHPFYRTIMGTWLVPLGGFFWFATATYELAAALLLLSRGKWVKLGKEHWGASPQPGSRWPSRPSRSPALRTARSWKIGGLMTGWACSNNSGLSLPCNTHT